MTSRTATLQAPPPSSKSKLRVNAHQGQLRLIKSRSPTVAAIAGTGGGKTVGGMAKLITSMLERPAETWLVVEPTWPMVDRILMHSTPARPSLLALLRLLDPKTIYSKTTRTIHSLLGTIFLASATHPESMEGAHVAGAWPDEAGQMSRLAYETMQRRCAFKSGQVIITTTPYNRGWLYKEVFLPARAGNQDIEVIQFPSTANPAYPQDVYERHRQTMSPARFRMMHEGGFERPEGLIYTQWTDELIVEPFPIPADWWTGAGLDFGWNHPTAAVWAARDPDGVYYIYREYLKPETLLAAHYKALTAKHNGARPPGTWIADPSAKQERAELRRLGIQARPAINDVLTGIDTVAELMATGRLKVFRTCLHWLDEVEAYIWDTKQDSFTDKPVKLNDDLMDATRYLLHTTEKRPEPHLYT